MNDDVRGLLTMLREGLEGNLGDQLVGLYLTGSLTYGDFDPAAATSIFVAILDHELSDRQRVRVRDLHAAIAAGYPQWASRIEESYI